MWYVVCVLSNIVSSVRISNTSLLTLMIKQVRASALPLSSGIVKTRHGFLPVPCPATLKLLEGFPTVRFRSCFQETKASTNDIRYPHHAMYEVNS